MLGWIQRQEFDYGPQDLPSVCCGRPSVRSLRGLHRRLDLLLDRFLAADVPGSVLGTHVLWYHGELCPQVTPECLLCVWPDLFQHLWVLRRPYRFRIRYRLIRGPSRWPSVGVQGHPVEQLHRRGTPDRSSLRCYFEREEKRGERSEKTAKTGEGVRGKEPRETRRISHFICE